MHIVFQFIGLCGGGTSLDFNLRFQDHRKNDPEFLNQVPLSLNLDFDYVGLHGWTAQCMGAIYKSFCYSLIPTFGSLSHRSNKIHGSPLSLNFMIKVVPNSYATITFVCAYIGMWPFEVRLGWVACWQYILNSTILWLIINFEICFSKCFI